MSRLVLASTIAAAAALSTPTAGDFVRELRGAKTALLRGVAAEGGALSEDALALMDGLGRVNPSSPNPAADVDLWANDYDVRSHLPLPTPPGWDGWDASTEAAIVRLRRDEAEFEAGVLLAGDPELRGRLRFAGPLSVPAGSRTALEWRPTELELEFDDGSDAAARRATRWAAFCRTTSSRRKSRLTTARAPPSPRCRRAGSEHRASCWWGSS